MLKRLEADALKADLESVLSILSSTTEDEDPIGYMQFEARRNAIEKRISDLTSKTDLLGSVGLFFNGRPVIGSRGIVATFGAKAVEEFQNVVSTRLAARNGNLGRRGRIPQTSRAQMLITDAVRGSFGFVLEEHGTSSNDEGVSELKEVMSDVVDLLNNTTNSDEQKFDEAKEDMNERVLASVQSFFRLLDDEGATLRIVEGDRELEFDRDAILRAKTRTDNISIEDNVVEMTGQLYIMPNSRLFELNARGGNSIKGRITPDSLASITEENGDIGVGALGTWCTVRVLIHNVRKNDSITSTTYRLIDVVSVKNPPPAST